MRKSVISTLLAGCFAVAAGSAFAGEPMKLTDRQMDGVSAGAGFILIGMAGGVGDWINVSSGSQVGLAFGNNAIASGSFGNLSVSLLTPAASHSSQTIQVNN